MTTLEIEGRIDGRRARGDRSRRAILEAAASLASVEGLEGLTLGRLAEHLAISKSGVYAHFGSKEELQLATIRAALDMYGRDVMGRASAASPGIPRIIAFADTFLDYIQHGPFPGGCFFIASSLDPARLRARVQRVLADNQRQLLDLFDECIRVAQKQGAVDRALDPEHTAFAVDAILVGADMNFVLFGDARYLEFARGETVRQPARQVVDQLNFRREPIEPEYQRPGVQVRNCPHSEWTKAVHYLVFFSLAVWKSHRTMGLRARRGILVPEHRGFWGPRQLRRAVVRSLPTARAAPR